MEWESVIGLEVHVQLKTKSKIFSGASTQYGQTPNTQACIIDLGFPGILPVLNKEALNMAIKFGLAINAQICKKSVFTRKNYFYPDLPKGYQISQCELPIIGPGQLKIEMENNTTKIVGIVQAHLEEDAGKSLHEDFNGLSGIDLNRAGIPLLEIISEPDIRSAKEAVTYLKTLHILVCYLDICDGNMQESSFRCDTNVSVRPKGQEIFGTRVEIKNINSFRFVEKAIDYEIQRQVSLIKSGRVVIQETRLYDAERQETRPMRYKEEANDYRYFPDPDLLPVYVSEKTIQQIRSELPELPQQKVKRFMSDFKLTAYDAKVLTSSKALADYFETALKIVPQSPKIVANWISVELLGLLNKHRLSIEESLIPAKEVGYLVLKISDGTISGKIAKLIFYELWQNGGIVDTIIEKKGLKQINDPDTISQIIDEVIEANASQLADYRNGKNKLFGFFVGQVMKKSQFKANPVEVKKLLKAKFQQ